MQQPFREMQLWVGILLAAACSAGAQAQPQSGEDACENRGYTAEQCANVGCCTFENDGRCWSNVGDGPCSTGDTYSGDDSCDYAHDGMCDEQASYGGWGCDPGTDCTDCGGDCYMEECTGDCAEAAAAVLGIVVVICLVSFIALGGGIYCCVHSKSQQGSRPTGTAWLASLVICIFVGPLCMWIPFVIDSCYEPVGGRQNTVIIQQQVAPVNLMMPQQPVMGQPVMGQPVMATATAQPMMATAQAQPMMATAQAQPMMATAQAQPMSKVAQGP